MKYKALIPLLLTTLMSIPSVALGKMVTIEPDDFEHGTDISYLNKSVALNAISVNRETEEFEYGSVYSITSERCIPETIELVCDSEFVAPTGSKVFGWKDDTDHFRSGWGDVDLYQVYVTFSVFPDDLQGLMASFSRNTNYVSIKATTLIGSDENILVGLNRSGELVAASRGTSLWTEDYVCCNESGESHYWVYENSISTVGNEIAYVVTGGSFATNRLDHLTFNVSEPRVVPIFLVALAGLAFMRQRRHLKR